MSDQDDIGGVHQDLLGVEQSPLPVDEEPAPDSDRNREQEPAAPARTQSVDAAGDPMEEFRSKGHALEFPQAAIGHDWDDDALVDFGHAAAHAGVPKELAQAFVDLYAETGERLPDGGFDQQRTLMELRFDWSDAFDTNLRAVQEFVAARPALGAWLDATGNGNSPGVLRLLAGVARNPDLLDPAKAQAFLNDVNADLKHSYWRGDKTALAQVRIAYAVTSR